jgi:hypothetical protein
VADRTRGGTWRRWRWIAVALAVGVMVFVLAWFQPQKLFIDDRVQEAIPRATSAPLADTDDERADPSTKVAATELARGEFTSRDHDTSGVARMLELADGRRIVRLEELDTDNGPDLYLYLGSNPADGDEGEFDDDFVNLGRLKGNQGDQNYELPDGTDPERHRTVVIWCDRFDSAFGAADLN